MIKSKKSVRHFGTIRQKREKKFTGKGESGF